MRRTRLAPRSQQRIDEHYADFVVDYLARHRRCEVGPLIATVVSWRGCRQIPGGLHHLRKRSASGALTNPANTLASCHPCNNWVEEFPLLARSARLVVREGDPEWDALGARTWRGK